MFCIKESLENAAAMERFEDSPLGKELKAQTDMAKKQYQILGSTFESDKIIKKEEPTLKNYNESNLIYNSKHIFHKYHCKVNKLMEEYDCKWTRNQNNLVRKRTLNHLAKLLRVRLRTKWLWVQIQLQSLHLQISRLF